MNIFTRSIDSAILKNKIDTLSRALKKSIADQDKATLEQLQAEATALLSSFYHLLDKPKFNPRIMVAGDVPDFRENNRDLQDTLDDLNILFLELENVEALTLQNFNFFVSESNRLNSKVKSISAKLGDYALFSENVLKDTIFFSDSFNNLSNLETDPGFLTNPQCEINQAEGIVTLPIVRSPDSVVSITATPIINSNSNGVTGNNQEIGAERHDQIIDILDSNPDTWFEYERVVERSKDDGQPLILDLRLDLGSEKIVNFIRINPNNFGTKTQVDILDISTSTDGNSFVSVKDEIPIAGFNTIDEPNVFTLAPSTSKYAGQGLFTFTPRLARYLHLSLQQKSPYTINTLLGSRSRYAIGLRDVELQALRYGTVGEIVSREFISPDKISKLLINSNQNPSEESELVSVNHFISDNNGDAWLEIRPKEFAGVSDVVNEVPEVLSFTEDITRIRYRAVLRRNTEAFTEDSAALRQTVLFKTELHESPTTSPLVLNLEETPVVNSVHLIDPHFGSRGINSYRYTIAIGNQTKQIHQLPFQNIRMDPSKVLEGSSYFLEENSPVRVYVNGQQWSAANLSTASAGDLVYSLDHNRGILSFGDGTNGYAPDTGSTITIDFTPERFLSDKTSEGHAGKLTFPTNGDQDSISVRRYDAIDSHSEPLEKGSKVFRLDKSDIISGTVKFKPSGGAFTTEKAFIDGKVELTGAGQWSLDYRTGTLYSFTRTSSVTEVTVSYRYQPIVELDNSEWFFSDTSLLKDTLGVKDTAWGTIGVTDETIASGITKFSLSQLNIEPGTVSFNNATAFNTEVPFIDGRIEILGLIKATEVVRNGVLTGAGLKIFSLSLIPADATNHVVAFSNTTIFNTAVSDLPNAAGEYRITGRTVEVFITSTVTNPGSVTYFYQDPTKNQTGVYSIDYKLGNVYTFTPTSNDTVDYQYSRVEILYPIARVIPDEDIEVDIEGRRILVNDREVLRRVQIPSASSRTSNVTSTYQVVYNYVQKNRASIEDLEPFFTPILKDYIIKVLPRGSLF